MQCKHCGAETDESAELADARALLARVCEPVDMFKHPARLHWIAVDEARAFLAPRPSESEPRRAHEEIKAHVPCTEPKKK